MPLMFIMHGGTERELVSAPHAPLVIAARQVCLFKPRVLRELREEDGYPLGE